MKKKILITLLVGCIFCSMFVGCNSTQNSEELEKVQEELVKTQEELVKTQEDLTKAQQTISDYEAVYGKIERSDVDENIDPANVDKNILVLSANNPTAIIEKDKFKVALSDFFYVAGNDNIVLTTSIENYAGQKIEAKIINVYVENCSLPPSYGEMENFIDSGQVGGSYNYFSASPLNSNNLTNFDKLGGTLVVNAIDGSNLYSRDFVIMRDAFSETMP